jgi:hypothetical protein
MRWRSRERVLRGRGGRVVQRMCVCVSIGVDTCSWRFSVRFGVASFDVCFLTDPVSKPPSFVVIFCVFNACGGENWTVMGSDVFFSSTE